MQKDNTKDERKNWIEEVLEIAKKENIAALVEEGYDYSPLIRFKCPDNPEEEAGVYVWYKKVEIFSDDLRFDFWFLQPKDYDLYSLEGEFKDLFESIIERYIGYKKCEGYDGLVKDVETPEETVYEIKSLLDKKIWEIENSFLEAYRSIGEAIEKTFEELEYRLSPEKKPEKKREEGKIIRIIPPSKIGHKTPKYFLKEGKDGKSEHKQDK